MMTLITCEDSSGNKYQVTVNRKYVEYIVPFQQVHSCQSKNTPPMPKSKLHVVAMASGKKWYVSAEQAMILSENT